MEVHDIGLGDSKDGSTLHMANQYEQREHGCSGEAAALLRRKDIGVQGWAESKGPVNSSLLNKVLTMGRWTQRPIQSFEGKFQ